MSIYGSANLEVRGSEIVYVRHGLASFGFVWSCLACLAFLVWFGIVWLCLVSFRTVSDSLALFCTCWYWFALCGPVRICFHKFGIVWICFALFRNLMNCLVPFGDLLAMRCNVWHY